jgi:hypothetical protein
MPEQNEKEQWGRDYEKVLTDCVVEMFRETFYFTGRRI